MLDCFNPTYLTATKSSESGLQADLLHYRPFNVIGGLDMQKFLHGSTEETT